MKDKFEIKDNDMEMILKWIFIGVIIISVIKSCSSTVSDYSADDNLIQFESQFR